MTAAAFPLLLPLDGMAPRQIAVEPSYDWAGDGACLPALVLALNNYAEVLAATNWLAARPQPEAPAGPASEAEPVPYTEVAENLALMLDRQFPDPHQRLAVASALLATVALDAGIDDPEPVAGQLVQTMVTIATLRDDLALIESEDARFEDADDAEGEFAA